MTRFFDLTKQTPEQIVAELVKMCEQAQQTGEVVKDDDDVS